MKNTHRHTELIFKIEGSVNTKTTYRVYKEVFAAPLFSGGKPGGASRLPNSSIYFPG